MGTNIGLKKDDEVSYADIEPLIANKTVEGTKLHIEFQLVGSDDIIESSAPIRRGRDTKSKTVSRVKRTAAMQARMATSRVMRRALGSGMIGRTANIGFNTASRDAIQNTQNSKKDVENACVEAFLKVKDYFVLDESTGNWGQAPTPPPPRKMSPFEDQATNSPIVDPHDQSVFARMLAELANADGHIAPEEQAFFSSVIPPGGASLQELLAGDPVSRIECEMVTEGVKETIYMFAWAISLSDMDIDPIEKELLMEYADTFGFPDYRRDELVQNAKFHILEQAIDPDIPRNELFDLADKIELPRDDAERCKVAYIRREG